MQRKIEETKAIFRRAGGSPSAFISRLIPDRLLVCSLAGNFILCSLGLIAAPAAYQTAAIANVRRPLEILILAGCVLTAILFVSAMGCLANGKRQSGFFRDFPAYLKRSGEFAICFVCAVLAYALLCGCFSVIIYMLFRNTLSYEAIKSVINIITGIATIAAAPIVLMELLAFTLSRLPVKKAIRAGIAGSRGSYKRLLFITAGFALAGALLSAGIHHISGIFLQRLITLIAYTIIGGLGTYAVYRTGMKAYGRQGTLKKQNCR